MTDFDAMGLVPKTLRDQLVALRCAIHSHPELSNAEHQTADRLYAALATFAPAKLERVGKTGIVARIAGRNPKAPVVAVRGDIDALPIQEDTGLSFASKVPGVMHACGHDVHATWAVGAGALLAASPAEGDVLVVLQPAEETGTGAREILESGVLRDVAAIFGAHVDRRFPVGEVVAQPGPIAASADSFEIVLHGRGAHAARPHEAADPIVGAAALVSALQTIIARRIDPAAPAVLSVTMIHAGTATNVIPDRATIAGTVRATDPKTRSIVNEELARIAESIASAHGLRAETRLELGPPPVVNSEEPAKWAREAATRILGPKAVVPFGITNMAGEDFAFYLEKIPGCFLRVGAREPGTAPIPAHSPKFYAAEESIFIGAAVLAESARVASAALHERVKGKG